MSGGQKQFAILAGIMSALLLAAWFIRGRPAVHGGEYGAVAVFVAIRVLGLSLEFCLDHMTERSIVAHYERFGIRDSCHFSVSLS